LKHILKVFKDITRYNNMVEGYSRVDYILITTIINLCVETRKWSEIVNLLIQRNCNNFFNIYSTRLKETKNFSSSNMMRYSLLGMVP